MAATMRILGWRAENLRCPDHEINFLQNESDTFKVSLIQMPNGTGKTTTLTLLRTALSGAAQSRQWDREQVRAFQKKGSNEAVGRFEVRLLMNGKRVTIIMTFDFDNGTVSYRTTHGEGQVERFDPPVAFRRFMNDQFVDFYVFDGELAQHLLDRDYTDAERVVELLFQVDMLRRLSGKITQYWEDKTENAGATEERGLKRRKKRVDNLKQRLSDLEVEAAHIRSKREQVRLRLEKQQQAYNLEIGKEESRAVNLEEARTRVRSLEVQVRDHARTALDKMAEPHALSPIFAHTMFNLKAGLDRVKLPESAAREFFEELAQEQECVCGRPIDEEIRAVIRGRSQQYLGSDDVSLLNIMKTAIVEAVGESREKPAEELDQQLHDLDQLMQAHLLAQNELDELELEAGQADPAVRQAQEEIKGLEKELNELESELQKYESDDDRLGDDSPGIEVIRRRYKKAEEDFAEITQTLEMKNKRDILIDILSKAHRKAKESITKEICDQANLRIADLLPYNDIRIACIDRCLVLKDQAGGSVGEQLSIAYAFLSTLFHRAENQLPFIVDSPAGSIDLATRPRISDLIPKLSNQFIAFTISSEREAFVPRLKRSSGDSIQFITLFRKSAKELGEQARAVDVSVETTDGFCVTDEKFFNDFQFDAED